MMGSEYSNIIAILDGELQYLKRVGSATWRQKRVEIALQTAQKINEPSIFLNYENTLKCVMKINSHLNDQCSADVAKYLYNTAWQAKEDFNKYKEDN